MAFWFLVVLWLMFNFVMMYFRLGVWETRRSKYRKSEMVTAMIAGVVSLVGYMLMNHFHELLMDTKWVYADSSYQHSLKLGTSILMWGFGYVGCVCGAILHMVGLPYSWAMKET